MTRTWPCTLEIHGSEIVVRGVFATWFGGTRDPLDSGETASGISTRAPGVLGCALPIPVVVRGKEFGPTAGSPFPRGLPWRTMVTVQRRDSKTAVTVPLIDRGPAFEAAADGDVIDLTPATFAALGIPVKQGVPTRGRLPVSFVIWGGAKFLKK